MLRGKAALIRNMKVRSAVSEGQQLPCAYSHRVCAQPRLEGYEYCLQHILEDKNSPYRQCSYQAPKTGRKCTNPAPKPERADRKDGGRLCPDHSKQMMIAHMKAGRRRRPKETAELLLEELDASNETAADISADAKRSRRLLDSVALKALEYGTSSESDREELLVEQTFRPDNDSDADSIDSDQEDPLKHAGVYSQEEAALILRDKLIRLQSLYIDQFKRLQHILKEKRRKYLQTVKQERETLGPIQAYKLDPTHNKKYERLQAMKRFHTFRGKEALLHQKCDKRRLAVAEGVNHRPPSFPRCHMPTPDGRCNQRVVPLSKMCFDHILKDTRQVLFEPCCFRNGQCDRPVVNIEGAPLCHRHFAAMPLPTSIQTQTEDLQEKQNVSEATQNSNSTVDMDQPLGLRSKQLEVEDIDIVDERLNSSGEGNLDLGVEDIMESEDLIRLVDDILEESDGAAIF